MTEVTSVRRRLINRLAFGNIESDPEMIELYQELLGFINGKKLRQEDSQKLRESYERRQKEAYYRSMYEGFAFLSPVQTDNMQATSTTEKYEGGFNLGIAAEETVGEKGVTQRGEGSFGAWGAYTKTTQDTFLPLLGWVGNITISAVSSIGMSYYGYQAEKERIHGEIESGLWQMQKDEIEACHALQMKLLNSSWRLLRQYRLPDEYRLTEANLAKFFKAMETDNTANRLKMLKMIERDFRAYPVYWFYRARAASDSGDTKESELCFDKFNEVWRPVLRKDCYKVEASKYQISRIVKSETLSNESLAEIHKLADTIQEYSPEDDWSSNLFSGFVYFALGDKEKAVMCLEENLLFGYEKEVSGAVLDEMKKRSSDFTFKDITGTMRRNEIERRKIDFLASIKSPELSDGLTKYFDAYGSMIFPGFECLMQGKFQESKQYFDKVEEYCDGLFIIGTMYAKSFEVETDYKKASAYYEEAARLGHMPSQLELGNLYYDGGYNLEREYMKAYMWYSVIAEIEHSWDDDWNLNGAVEYLSVAMGYIIGMPLYNVATLGGTWQWFTDENDIKGLAEGKVVDIEGFGWFNLSKGSKEEKGKARQEADKIRQQIPAKRKNWK